MKDESTPRDPLAATADALEKALAELDARKQAAAELAATNAPQVERLRGLEKRLATLPQRERREVLDAMGLHHVSAVPPPIERVLGSGPMRGPRTLPMERPSAPIAWGMWLAVPKVALWEAVALVLGINPKALQFHSAGWAGGGTSGPFFEPTSFPNEWKREDFLNSLSFAKKATGYQSPIALPMGYLASGSSDVALREVVAFFQNAGAEGIPAALQAALSEPEAEPDETKEEREDRRLQECEDAGLQMPDSHVGRLPDGIGKIAAASGFSRQTYSDDVKAALNRREQRRRAGS